MGDIDISARELLQDKEEFAKVFNLAFYNGLQVIKPEELRDADSVCFMAGDSTGKDSKGIIRLRDLARSIEIKEDSHTKYVLLGIENQSCIDYGMPLRLLHYDVIIYMSQMRSAGNMHRKVGDWNSITSDFGPTDCLTPVLTLVVYYGDKPWDGPTELSEMFCDIPQPLADGIVPYLPTYRIKVVSAECADMELDLLGEKLRAVLYYARSGGNYERLEKILTEHPDLTKVPKPAARLISKLMNVNPEIDEQKETVDMENLFEQLKDIGYKKGIEAGRAEGIATGRAEIIRNMFQEGMKLSTISKVTRIPLANLEQIIAVQGK